jgi:hypothetical protein
MLSILLAALCLMAACVASHAAGVTTAVRWLRRIVDPRLGQWAWTWVFVRLAAWMIVVHLIEITLWAVFLAWRGAMPDFQSAVYFSAVTYTTTGYGDLVLPVEWRLLGAVEALTGILMCGWSTGFFFAIVSRMFEAKPHR